MSPDSPMRIAEVDRPTFDERVTPHLDCLFRAARRELPSDDLAWDLVQTLLVRVWHHFELPQDPRAVLLSLVPKVGLEMRRNERRRAGHEKQAAQTETYDEHTHCEHPQCHAEREELRAHVRAAIDSLPTDVAPLLREQIESGLDYAVLAERHGLPIGTVRSRLHRARRILRDRLAKIERKDAA